MEIISKEVIVKCLHCGASLCVHRGDIYWKYYPSDGMGFFTLDCPACEEKQACISGDVPGDWIADMRAEKIVEKIGKRAFPKVSE